MPKVVYGVFRDGVSAGEALDKLHADARYRDIDAVLHQGYVREEDVQLGGTHALSGMILGGLVVGLLGAFFAYFFIWPMAGYWFGWPEVLLVTLAGSLFGVVAGGVAGASECKGSIREGARRVGEGHVMVTAELAREDVAGVVELMRTGTGADVHAA